MTSVRCGLCAASARSAWPDPRGDARSQEIPDLDEGLKMQLEDVVELIRMEYAELPGLKLTVCQAQRLWDVSSDLCTTALETLIRCQFLERTTDGSYVRRWHDYSPVRSHTALF